MGKKKLVYLVTSGPSILAAAILLSADNSSAIEAGTDGKEIDPLDAWKEVNGEKRVPLAVQLLEEEAFENEENSAGAYLARGIELYAYDVNNPNHFDLLSKVLDTDQKTLQDLTEKGEVYQAAKDHLESLNSNSEVAELPAPDDSEISDREKALDEKEADLAKREEVLSEGIKSLEAEKAEYAAQLKLAADNGNTNQQ